MPAQVNGNMEIQFMIDSGASDVVIPDDVFRTLLRTGTISEADFLGTTTYVLADGSKVPGRRYILRKMQVGTYSVENVIASVGSMQSDPLLGQSFLQKFQSWTLDNDKEVLNSFNWQVIHVGISAAEQETQMLRLLMVLYIIAFGGASAVAEQLRDMRVLNGRCAEKAHTAEGPVGSDLTKRQSRFFCELGRDRVLRPYEYACARTVR